MFRGSPKGIDNLLDRASVLQHRQPVRQPRLIWCSPENLPVEAIDLAGPGLDRVPYVAEVHPRDRIVVKDLDGPGAGRRGIYYHSRPHDFAHRVAAWRQPGELIVSREVGDRRWVADG